MIKIRHQQARPGQEVERSEMMFILIFSEVGPADIQVVAGLGDYLVSGAGALANTTSDTFRDFPQVSFATGED